MNNIFIQQDETKFMFSIKHGKMKIFLRDNDNKLSNNYKNTILCIAKALGLETNSRMKKSDIIKLILKSNERPNYFKE